MTIEKLKDKLKEKFNLDYQVEVGLIKILVPKESWGALAEFLRFEAGFNYFSFITAVDRKDKFVMVCRVENLEEKTACEFTTEILPHETLSTLSELWEGAVWQEREVFDLFGIKFENHPDLKRILLPEDYSGHPLKKEFPLDKHYEPYR